MAPNTSSVFNEAAPASTETKPTSADTSVLVASPPSSAVAPSVHVADASVSSTASSTSSSSSSSSSSSTAPVSTVPSSHVHSEDYLKQPQHIDCDASVSSSIGSSEQHALFARVSPHGLESVKPLAHGFRKSCLKRSNSALPADIAILKQEAIDLDAAACALPAVPVQKNRRRCWECKVKVGLTAVRCRCEYTFCNKHRYAEEHSCSFDFKVSAKRKLEEENPRVVPLKVARIN